MLFYKDTMHSPEEYMYFSKDAMFSPGKYNISSGYASLFSKKYFRLKKNAYFFNEENIICQSRNFTIK
jgi:hypothetical protein